jgi:hypothetical protein
MIDFAGDIPLFLDSFGEAVTFTGPGNYFDCRGIFSVNEEPIIPMDGEKARPHYTLACAAADVTGVTPRYTVKIRNVEYRILAVTFNPVLGMTEILLGQPS